MAVVRKMWTNDLNISTDPTFAIMIVRNGKRCVWIEENLMYVLNQDTDV